MTAMQIVLVALLVLTAAGLWVMVVSEERRAWQDERDQAEAVAAYGDPLPFQPVSVSPVFQRRDSSGFGSDCGAAPKTVRPGSLSDRLQRRVVHT